MVKQWDKISVGKRKGGKKVDGTGSKKRKKEGGIVGSRDQRKLESGVVVQLDKPLEEETQIEIQKTL